MTLGQKIRSARIGRGMTQKELVGDHITRNMLSRIENDSAMPSMRTLEYIAGRLDLPAGYFMADSRWSDGTSPDGLDDMRLAYRQGRWTTCIELLEHSEAGTTDEGYLLLARACLAEAREHLKAGRYEPARQYADLADYYNRQGMYYSAEIDAEMSLILAECALELDRGEFEENAAEFERAVKAISFSGRYALAKAEYLLSTGEAELAVKALSAPELPFEGAEGRYRYLLGAAKLELGDAGGARPFLEAARAADPDGRYAARILQALETCCTRLGDYKAAYEYAALRLK